MPPTASGDAPPKSPMKFQGASHDYNTPMRFRLRTLLAWINGGGALEVNPYESPQTSSNPRSFADCSFCGKNHRDVGPLAEGPNEVYICRYCVQHCSQLIADELKRLGTPSSENPV